MSVNGVTGTQTSDNYGKYASTKQAKATTEVAAAPQTENTSGVVYEKTEAADKKYKPNAELIAKMKADTEARTAQMKSLVTEMMTKQGNSYGQANDMWKFLAGGNFTVDAATKSQAQKDIAADGYWGVDKTSDRIFEFAKALSGGDPETMEKMRDAFDKGFKQATKSWGKELPGISGDTYDSVMSKFDKFAEENE